MEEKMRNSRIAENNEITENSNIFYAVAMRGVVAFPNMVLHFDAARKKSVASIEKALGGNKKIFLVTQRDRKNNDPAEDDLYKIGVIAEIKQVLRSRDDRLKVIVEGIRKAEMIKLMDDGECLTAKIRRMPNYRKTKCRAEEIEAVVRSLKNAFGNYASYFPNMPKELAMSIQTEDDPCRLFEEAASSCDLNYQRKQSMLEEPTVVGKLFKLIASISEETEILEIAGIVNEQAQNSIDKGQREYFLREQLHAIQEQLGESDEFEENAEYINKILELKVDEKSREKLLKEAERVQRLSPMSPEAAVIKNYLDTVLELPWGKYTGTEVSLDTAQTILERDHYGLKRVKERILEFLAVHTLNPDVKGQIICLAGPPGIGKTSIAKSIAEAMGREYVRVSLGGVRDEADIRGHRKTYVGSMPGRIISAVNQAGTSDPLILFDEIDKLCSDIKGDPASAMLEVLDSAQNSSFRDHFLEIPFDLSKAVFITTANNIGNIPEPLLDRMEIIELPSYTAEEKFHIAKEHLVPKQLREHGIKGTQLKFQDKTLNELIDGYTREAGVRGLERCIASLCRKAARKLAEGETKRVTVKASELQNWLGPRKYLPESAGKGDGVGIVNGLAWTAVGGVIMPMETLILNGTGKTEITGSLGDVMKESAMIAVSCVRSLADKYGIDPDFHKNKDIHIHAPEGAVPKDGPSAGVTMTTALVSALSGRKVRGDVAMTGEITLLGRVLPIGGLREKSMAAYRAGIKTVIIPSENRADLEEVDDTVKNDVKFVFARNIEDVLSAALVRENAPETKKRRGRRRKAAADEA